MERKGILTVMWILWVVTVLSALAFGIVSLLVINGLLQWATSTTIDIAGVSDRLTGVIGASGIFLAALALYLVLSIVVLLGRVCSSPEALDFRYGAFSAFTLGMAFIVSQTALILQASQYLVDTFVDFEPVIPVFGATPNDEQLFITALIQGYVTAGLFLLLFLFIMTHQFAVCCGYCPPIQDKPKRKKAPKDGGDSLKRTSTPVGDGGLKV